MPLNHFAVHRADLVREHGQLVADDDLVDRNVLESGADAAVRDGRHAARQGAQHRRRLRHGELLERVSSGQHEDDDGAREVFAEQRGRDDRDAGQVIGAEAPVEASADEIEDERNAGEREDREERRVSGRAGQPAGAQNQVQGDARNREQRRQGVKPPRQAAPFLSVVFDALDFDRALFQHGRDRGHGCQHGREDGAEHAQRQRKLCDGICVVLDDDAAHVAFVQELLHRVHELFSGDFEGFREGALRHDRSP